MSSVEYEIRTIFQFFYFFFFFLIYFILCSLQKKKNSKNKSFGATNKTADLDDEAEDDNQKKIFPKK